MKLKRKTLLNCFFVLSLLIVGCSDNTEDNFENINEVTAKKVLSKVEASDYEDGGIYTASVNYDSEGKITSASDFDGDVAFFNYDQSEDLTSISSEHSTRIMADLYKAPFDASNVGAVLDYDNNGNPTEIMFYDEKYSDEYPYEETTVVYYAELSYDNKPNAFFYTLQSTGLIDVLDKIQINFNINPQNEDLVKAKMLLPVNNLKSLIVKDPETNQTVYEVQVEYEYDSDNFPTVANIIALDASGVATSTVKFYYKTIE